MVHRRPYIAQVVGTEAICFANPKESHIVATKKIFRYLKGIEEYDLWYPPKGTFELSVFTNVDYVGNIDYKKSTIGGAFCLGGRLVAWTNKKKNCIS